MRRCSFVFAAILLTCACGSASAQTGDEGMFPFARSVVCAPPPTAGEVPAQALRVIGSQDPAVRTMFADRDLLVIDGGTSNGVQPGQVFLVRRLNRFAGSRAGLGVTTAGSIRIVAVNASTAIGLVDRACTAILTGDYLEPFVAPVVSAAMAGDDPTGQPDFTTLGHIIVGSEARTTLAAGDFALIDWGGNRGLSSGARFAIYRDVGDGGLPLASVGEGVVISIGGSTALTRITSARDAVYRGDYIALRK